MEQVEEGPEMVEPEEMLPEVQEVPEVQAQLLEVTVQQAEQIVDPEIVLQL